MSDDRQSGSGGSKPPSGDFDVVWLHGKTPDGEGANVLRLRPGRLEAGEVRPLKEGRPLQRRGQVVKLVARPGTDQLYDVDVQYEPPSQRSDASRALGGASGPPQVASRSYRESWERTFGAPSARTGKSALN